MTDEEIIKALECCSSNLQSTCDNCPIHYRQSAECVAYLAKNALVFINRQKAEIEQYETQNAKLKNFFTVNFDRNDLEEIVSRQIRDFETDIIRKFTKKLKEKALLVEIADYEYAVLVDDIDELVKEMTEVKDNGKV